MTRPLLLPASSTAPQRRRWTVLAATAAVLAAAGLSYAQTAPQPAAGDPLIAKVNGVEIHRSDLALAEEDVGQSMPANTEDAKRDYLVNYLTDMILLSKAAEAKKIPDDADFKRRLNFARNKVLMETLLIGEGKGAVNNEAMQKVYQEAIKQMGDEQEVHARHILFRVPDASDKKASEEAEAKVKTTIARAKKGEDFAALAKELTEDPAGKQDGGDLGYFTKDQMVPEFSDVAFKLDKGQLSEPVKTQFGWHVLKVEDKRKKEPPAFDKVKDQLETYVVRKAQVELVTKLRADAKIERLDKPAADAKPADKPAEPAKPAEPKK
jgi:peptidyl-prolyl cis-trans isomerase C